MTLLICFFSLILAAISDKHYIMGGVSSQLKFAPGVAPDRQGKPASEEFYDQSGILRAYQDAGSYIMKNPKQHYCTIGPNNQLIKWSKDPADEPVKIKAQTMNFILVYSDELKIKFPEDFKESELVAVKKVEAASGE